ncbi:MAG: hypothetical protein HY735_36205 [Verrucomicrobia bacterium]|nr:hypothetical protein [Verrucomicrobiota bacterium]
MKPSNKSCFVIMPLSRTRTCTAEEWTDIYNQMLPTLARHGYACHRCVTAPGSVLRGILENVIHCDLVIADLTDRNANVFYELGVRHAMSNRTVILTQRSEDVPFDLRGYAYYVYGWRTEADRRAFKEAIGGILQIIESEPNRVDSPIGEFFAGKGTEWPFRPSLPEQFTWGEYWRSVNQLADQLSPRTTAYKGFKPDLLIGISRGGSALADFLSALLDDTPAVTLWAERFFGPDPADVTYSPPNNPFNRMNFSAIVQQKGISRILLVDDYCKTGTSMRKALEFLRLEIGGLAEQMEFKTAILATVGGLTRTIEPDYCIHPNTSKSLLPYWRG